MSDSNGTDTNGHIYQTNLTTDGVVIALAGGVLSSTAAGTTGQVLIGVTGSVPVFAATGAITSWTDQAVSFNAVAGNGYFVTAAGVTATMPATPSQGDTISFVVTPSGAGFIITGNTGQRIRWGNAISSTTPGTATNNAQGDSVTLVYRTSPQFWYVIASQGIWTLS